MGRGTGVGAAGEGRPATSVAAFIFIHAGFETATWRIGLTKTRSGITASNFQAILRPPACLLTMRTMVPIMSRRHKMSMIMPCVVAAMASACTASMSTSEQMSEPWHKLKPAHQAGRRGRGLGARIDGCSRAGVIDGVSALLMPSPRRYAGVVPAQNILACSTVEGGVNAIGRTMPKSKRKPMYMAVPMAVPMWREQQQPQHLR